MKAFLGMITIILLLGLNVNADNDNRSGVSKKSRESYRNIEPKTLSRNQYNDSNERARYDWNRDRPQVDTEMNSRTQSSNSPTNSKRKVEPPLNTGSGAQLDEPIDERPSVYP